MFTALRGPARPIALSFLLLALGIAPFVLIAAAEKEPSGLPHLLESAPVEGVEVADLALRDLPPEDHRNIAAILSQEGRPEDTHRQETAALAKQAEEMAEVASNLEVLNAYLTDQQAVEYGEAPEDFEQPPLSVYKAKEIAEPLTSPTTK
jgi:hypothetical protein